MLISIWFLHAFRYSTLQTSLKWKFKTILEKLKLAIRYWWRPPFSYHTIYLPPRKIFIWLCPLCQHLLIYCIYSCLWVKKCAAIKNANYRPTTQQAICLIVYGKARKTYDLVGICLRLTTFRQEIPHAEHLPCVSNHPPLSQRYASPSFLTFSFLFLKFLLTFQTAAAQGGLCSLKIFSIFFFSWC